jgi:DNA-directed RNA polymerase beta' subunit
VRAICYKHLQNNFINKYGVALKTLFWSLARAKIQHIFDKVLGKIQAVKPAAVIYFQATVKLHLYHTSPQLEANVILELRTVEYILLPRPSIRSSLQQYRRIYESDAQE